MRSMAWLLDLHWSRYIIFAILLLSVFAVDYFGKDEEDDADFDEE
jgi:hypothetical protein